MKEKINYRKLYSIKKLLVVDSLNYLIDILEFNERKIRKKPAKTLTNELKIKIGELIQKHDNNEDIAGALEAIGKISKDYALEIITEYENILIEKILTGKETGDIGDIILVIADISKEKALQILEKISTDSILQRMYEDDFNLHIRSVGWLLKVLNELSSSYATDLLEKIGIDRIYQLIEKHWTNKHAIQRFIQYMENLSDEYTNLIKNKFNLE